MTAPTVAVGVNELLVAVVTRVDSIAQVRAGQRHMALMAWLAILVGAVLLVANVAEDVGQALLVHHFVE